MISKILVPTDGSKVAQKASRYAIDLAKKLKATVVVLSIIDKRFYMPLEIPVVKTARHIPETVDDYLREDAEKNVEEIKKLCKKNNVNSKGVVATGHPVEEIMKEARRSKVDLIVIGSHGRSALATMALGSVSYGVIHKDTKIPITIVKG